MVCGRKEEEAQLNFRCDLKRRAKKVFHIFLITSYSSRDVDRDFGPLFHSNKRHFYSTFLPPPTTLINLSEKTPPSFRFPSSSSLRSFIIEVVLEETSTELLRITRRH